MNQQIYAQLEDLRLKSAPLEDKLNDATTELHSMQKSINSRPHDIREWKEIVQQLEAKLEPLHERTEQLEAMLPGSDEIAAARKKIASLLKSKAQLEREHDEVFQELLPELERLVEIAAKLNTAKRERLKLTSEIHGLRREFNFDERNQYFVKFPETEGQKVAFLLASFLRDSIYELPSDTLQRDLAAEHKRTAPTEVAS